MNTTILLFLLQDGITNGAIYALLGLALVLVFAVTRVILIPQGEFVTYGALTYASLAAGRMPGTAKLAVVMGLIAFAFDLYAMRKTLHVPKIARTFGLNMVFPVIVLLASLWAADQRMPAGVSLVLSLLIVASIGLSLYRIVFQPLAHTSVLVLLIASVGVHLALQGLGLVFFGAEGPRGPTLLTPRAPLGSRRVTGPVMAVYG
ncbi:MAG: branched-chain amino acid ABC transporter permease, partial [Bradyrhizobium sp.]